MASSAILHSPSMFSQRLAIYPQQHQRIRITSKKFGNRAARTESKGVSLGFRPPQFQLTEPLTGSVWESEDFQSHPALLIMKNKKMSNKARSSPHSTTLNVNRALNKTRTKPPIWHDTWKDVPKDTKTKIWDCVQMAFIVPPSAKRMVLNSAGIKWREFKYEFMKIHIEQQERSRFIKYPHRMSRKGYAKLEEEWAESHPEAEEEIDRSTSWVLARKDKDGNFLNDEVAEKAKEIEKMNQEIKEGKVMVEGVNDVLTKVLDGGSSSGGNNNGKKKNESLVLPPREHVSTKMGKYVVQSVASAIKNKNSKVNPKNDDDDTPSS
ncbi:hypothetical protein POM88_003663 [Heracleum sosnowskyi]|uniref:Transposase n=1 Tax=Heracleum sosnowskyi TaxID=360622 RepID=A0AAD8NDR9_9APIA|nr:hypothetical protein POM88_003663 [Heracleum sosnowskyi]